MEIKRGDGMVAFRTQQFYDLLIYTACIRIIITIQVMSTST